MVFEAERVRTASPTAVQTQRAFYGRLAACGSGDAVVPCRHPFLSLAPQIGIVTETTRYPLDQANRALADLRAGRFEGAAILVP